MRTTGWRLAGAGGGDGHPHPGGDMKGLVVMALADPRLYLLAWLGAGGVYLV